MGERTSFALLLFLSTLVMFSTLCVVFAESPNWSVVTSFSGGNGIITTDEFICHNVEWRIRWSFSPRTDNPEFTSFQVYVYSTESKSYFASIKKSGTEETSGSLIVANHTGTFYLEIIASIGNSYSITIEKNLNSIPEFASWMIVPLCLTASLVVVGFRKKIRKIS
ncbi:MAG: hypothetical protein WC325_02960 [Candidatus Bathyarchaeia archaeon]